jgi:diguanylate cyclase (GGDEF)-like protein
MRIRRLIRQPRAPSLVATFALLSSVSLAALGFALAVEINGRIRQDALRDARDVASVTARFGIQPHISPNALRVGLAGANLNQVDTALRAEELTQRVVRVRVWNREAQVVYSDDRRLVGKHFAPSDGLKSAFTGRVASEVSSLKRSENADDRRYGRLLEVYVPLRTAAGGAPVGAFELYMPYAPIAARISSEARDGLLLLAGGLLLLWTVLMRIVTRASSRLRCQAEENRHQATHDALTGLPNRMLFGDRTSQALLAGRRGGDRVAVLLLDLDHFKEVNDTLGHKVGDRLIVEVGARLCETLRAADTVARLGGDEFAVLLPRVAGQAAAVAVAEQLRAALDEPFSLDGIAVRTEPSIGIAIFPDHGSDADSLLQHADVAMYEAKASRSRCAIYDPRRDAHDIDQLSLMADLRRALDEDQLALVFQPKLDPANGVIVGVEALVRWRHPTRGPIPPAEFIPPAEHTDLMAPLTRFVLRSALSHVRRWRALGRDLEVAVNVSVTDLTDELADELPAMLQSEGVPADRLTLEVTETGVMSDPLRAAGVLRRLSEAGVGVSIDDFGTGQTSLAYLKRLPIRELKIDRSFVSGMARNEDDAVIVSSTLRLGHDLGLRVVAEGAELVEQVEQLRSIGCDLVQGYVIARPMPGEELDRWLERAERARLYRVASMPAPRLLATHA